MRWFYHLALLSYRTVFALPRLATTSFEIGLAPFIDPSRQTLYLAIFSIVFLCWLGGFQENRQRY